MITQWTGTNTVVVFAVFDETFLPEQHLVGIFSTPEKADDFIAAQLRAKKGDRFGTEQWELDNASDT